MSIYIYKITNKENKKIYIGQTVDFQKRMKEHKYGRNGGKNSIIDRAYRKIGSEGFEEEIIDVAETQETADMLEKKYIEKFNSLKPNGYNVLKGGRQQHGAWNQKAILVYKLDGTFLKEYESSGELERESNGKYTSRSIRHSCKTPTHRLKDILVKYKIDSDEIKKYRKPASVRRKKVVQYDLDLNKICEFDSIQVAAQATNTNRIKIIECCKHRQKTTNGYVWRYEDDQEFDGLYTPKEIKRCCVQQIDDFGNILNVFVSCSSAARCLKLGEKAYKNIYNSITKDAKAYGYYWKRVNPVPSASDTSKGATTIRKE